MYKNIILLFLICFSIIKAENTEWITSFITSYGIDENGNPEYKDLKGNCNNKGDNSDFELKDNIIAIGPIYFPDGDKKYKEMCNKKIIIKNIDNRSPNYNKVFKSRIMDQCASCIKNKDKKGKEDSLDTPALNWNLFYGKNSSTKENELFRPDHKDNTIGELKIQWKWE